jgi:hypothetical protein
MTSHHAQPPPPAEVPLSDRIHDGCQFLIDSRNPDGGVAAVQRGDESGCWTSAEAILALLWLSARDPLVRHMSGIADFLVEAQVKAPPDEGSWPMVAGRATGSTMSTAHAVLALHELARSTSARSESYRRAAHRGALWLAAHAADGGGWGVEPSAGPAGAEPRTVSTYLALTALHTDDSRQRYAESRIVRDACDWLLSLREDGGFPARRNVHPDPCSTSRACLALAAAAYDLGRDDVLEAAVDFIMRARPRSGLWALDTERFVAQQAAGSTVFHMNTTAELLEFFVEFGAVPGAAEDLARWFAHHQRHDGSWRLGANEDVHADIVTWPTAEAVQVLARYSAVSGVSRSLLERSEVDQSALSPTDASRSPDHLVSTTDKSSDRVTAWRRATVTMLAVNLLLVALIVGVPGVLRNGWQDLPDDFRKTFVLATFIALLINLLSAAIVSGVGHLWRRRRRGSKA